MTPEEFIAAFVEGWTTSQPDGFIAFFGPLSHPDVIATQPMIPAAHGPDAYMRSFRNTFGLVKNAGVDVVSTAVSGDRIFIESVLSGTIGGRRTAIEVVDRFTLRDGLIYRRQSYFDPKPFIVAILLRPWVLPAVLRCLRG